MENFLGLDDKDFGPHVFSIIPVPYGETSTYGKGANLGPGAIIRASSQIELYDIESKSEPCKKAGIKTLAELDVYGLKPEDMVKLVYEKTKEVLDNDKKPIILGGDHSVSIGAVRAVKEKYENISILHFDAHSDLRNEYMGSKYNHACVGKRILYMGIPLVQLGVRSLSKEEADLIEENKNIKTYFREDYQYGKKELPLNEISDFLTDDIYITFDLDAFDPSIMPTTGTPEPGGLYWQEVLDVLKKILKKKNLKGFDLVELAPKKDFHSTDFLSAKLVYKIISYTLK